MKNASGQMSLSEEAKPIAWAEHNERLLNDKCEWVPDHTTAYPNHY